MNFNTFDFKRLNSPDFKEDSVREELILPLIQKLGYQGTQIVRSKTLKHPFLKIGSKKRPVNLIPDYLFQVDGNFAWVLDAKAPNEDIKSGGNLEQIYSYAIHPEIRTKFFALCNGKEFILFRQDSAEPEKAVLYFELRDTDRYWDELERLLGSNAFQTGKAFQYIAKQDIKDTSKFDYLNRPLLEEIRPQRQSARRHKGVHGYFTRQVWNVVNEYIRNFSQAGDTVLDPFGGSGVTAIEALMCDRKTIHIDLNPLSPFVVSSLLEPININDLTERIEKIKLTFSKKIPQTAEQIDAALKKYKYPTGFILPKGSDVAVIEDLFSQKQLA